MFTKANIRNGATYLSVHLSANDYYSQGEGVTGEWFGKLAENFGIAGEIIRSDDRTFENFRINLTPDGKTKLTPRRPDIRFFDFQCSAQKSVSIMAVTMGDTRLRDAHRSAVKIALSELERFAACRARRGASRFSDRNRITGNICAALFHHDASRALDAQLHTHAVVVNATFDHETGKVLALTEREMLKAIRYAGKVYQNALAFEVRKVGYDVEAVRKKGNVEGFEIAGVPADICRRFSKRRTEIQVAIDAFVAKSGHEPSPAEIHTLTTESRPSKLTEISTAQVVDRQRDQLSHAEMSHLQILVDTSFHRTLANSAATCDLQSAVDHLFERKSVLFGHEILAEALNQGLGSQDLQRLKGRLANGDCGLIDLVDNQRNPQLSGEFATWSGLQQEEWCRDFINRTQNKFSPAVRDFDDAIDQLAMPELREDQRSAARLICTCNDQVAAVRGLAGSGKSFMLRAVNGILGQEKVHFIAPTASAAQTLRTDGIPNATTCSDFLENISKTADLVDATVICDEAGLQSNKQGFALLSLAQRYQMRIRFVGDARQHVSVEAGDFLRVMEAHSKMQTAEVGTIERQKHEEYRKAIICMAAGQARIGLEKLQDLGWLIEGRSNYIEGAAQDFLRLTNQGSRPEECLVVAPTWDEIHRLTDKIRTHLKRIGSISESVKRIVHQSLKWTTQQKRTASNYLPGSVIMFKSRVSHFRKGENAEVVRVEGTRLIVNRQGRESSLKLKDASSWDVAETRAIDVACGDRVLIQANDHSLGLVNGDILTVDGIESDGTLHTREGKRISAEFKQWCHGYAVTSHKAQGVTAKNVVVAAATLDQKTAYVACSRGREQCLVHTPDVERLLERLSPGNRIAALEVLAEHPRYIKPLSIAARIKAWFRMAATGTPTLPETAPEGSPGIRNTSSSVAHHQTSKGLSR